MKKSNKYGIELKDEYNDISFIEKALTSDSPLTCIYAIMSCVKNNFKSDKVIENLKLLKNSKLIEWNSAKASDCAKAALDLLGIENITEIMK